MSSRLRAFGLALALCAGATAAAAHDFWVQPLQYWITPDSAVMTTLQVGHGKDRQRWDAEASRVVQFRSVGPGGAVRDHLPELRRSGMDQDRPIAFGAAGTHVLFLQTTHAESTLPGLRFTDYLKAEGLTPALELRERRRMQDKPGREIYSRRAKALVQVGAPTASAQPWVTRPVGFSLEIVPLANPYAPGAGEEIPIQVLWNGRPLQGALVKLNNLDFDGRPLEQARTDAAGRARFHTPRTGSWQLNVIWTRPLQGDPRADFETTFSSLTFGFPPRAQGR